MCFTTYFCRPHVIQCGAGSGKMFLNKKKLFLMPAENKICNGKEIFLEIQNTLYLDIEKVHRQKIKLN